jgi:hypothetical protein
VPPRFNNQTQQFKINKWRVSASTENSPVSNVIHLNLKKVQVNLQKDYLQVTLILYSGVELIFRIECAIDALNLSVSMIEKLWRPFYHSSKLIPSITYY